MPILDKYILPIPSNTLVLLGQDIPVFYYNKYIGKGTLSRINPTEIEIKIKLVTNNPYKLKVREYIPEIKHEVTNINCLKIISINFKDK